jgi:hypothetical protein
VILPTKHLSEEQTLLVIGAELLRELEEPLSVSELWERLRGRRAMAQGTPALGFDWFVLALTFLFTISAVERVRGLIEVKKT